MNLLKNCLFIIALLTINAIEARGGAKTPPTATAAAMPTKTFAALMQQVRAMSPGQVINAQGAFNNNFVQLILSANINLELKRALFEAGRNLHLPLSGNDDKDKKLITLTNEKIDTFMTLMTSQQKEPQQINPIVVDNTKKPIATKQPATTKKTPMKTTSGAKTKKTTHYPPYSKKPNVVTTEKEEIVDNEETEIILNQPEEKDTPKNNDEQETEVISDEEDVKQNIDEKSIKQNIIDKIKKGTYNTKYDKNNAINDMKLQGLSPENGERVWNEIVESLATPIQNKPTTDNIDKFLTSIANDYFKISEEKQTYSEMIMLLQTNYNSTSHNILKEKLNKAILNKIIPEVKNLNPDDAISSLLTSSLLGVMPSRMPHSIVSQLLSNALRETYNNWPEEQVEKMVTSIHHDLSIKAKGLGVPFLDL